MKHIKVLAGSLAAITAGATLALGIFAVPITSLGDYVKVSGSSLSSPSIVIGSPTSVAPGYAQDVVGAADIAAAVAGYATTSVSSGAVGLGVSNGAEVGTTNTKLYLGDTVVKSGVKSTLTKADLPTLLNSGTLTDTAGTNYAYDQYLNLQGAAVSFGNSGGDLTDPDLLLALNTTTTDPVVNYTITFNKLLNISSTNVQNQKLNILGVDYTIGATSSYTGASADQLVLYGSSLSQTMSGGEEKSVTVGGTAYTVKLIGVNSAGTAAYVSVGGDSQTINKGSTATISGLPVYVQDIFAVSTTDNTQNSVKLSFGTNKLTLANGNTVKKGTSDDTVDGTYVTLTGTANSGLSKIVISMAAKDSSHDFARQGAANAFVDPVFGAFKLALGGLNGGATETVTVDNSGTTAASLQFTDYRGNQKTITWAYTSSSVFLPSLNSTSTATYVVIENGTVKKNDYVLLTPSQESEFSHLMQYTSSSSLGSSGAYIELKDVMSDATSRFYLTGADYGTGTMYIDGQAYYAHNVTATATSDSYAFTWGASASATSVGTKITLFPLVKTSKGAWVTLVPGGTGGAGNVSISPKDSGQNSTGIRDFEVPGGDIYVDNTAGNGGIVTINCGTGSAQTFGGASGANLSGCVVGRMLYNVTSLNATAMKNFTTFSIAPAGAQLPYPAVVLREEKGKDVSNNDQQDFVVTTISAGSGTTAAVTVTTPVLTSATSASQSLQSDNSVTQYMDRYGTMVSYDSDSQGLVTITYPDNQAVATVAVGANPTFGAGTAGTVQAAVKLTSPVAKLASEVSTTAPGSDLILVGGPCANSLVAQLLAPAVTCSNWNYTTGIIKEVTGGFSDGSRALIVAGTQASDTRALAARLISGTLSYQA